MLGWREAAPEAAEAFERLVDRWAGSEAVQLVHSCDYMTGLLCFALAEPGCENLPIHCLLRGGFEPVEVGNSSTPNQPLGCFASAVGFENVERCDCVE
jgi:hypothetical protein